jgi:hypothetical protein
VSGLLGKLLGRLVSGRDPRRKPGERMMHLPGDILHPEGIIVYSGPVESDVWPSLFTANTLQKVYSNAELKIICSARDERLFNMLHVRPEVHCYASSPSIPDTMAVQGIKASSLFFYPYSKVIDSDRELLARIPCSLRIAPLDEESELINLVARTSSPYFPEKIQQMCSILGLQYDEGWKPEVQTHARRAAEQRMAPVTGRMMPYIVVSQEALAILERSRAEIPLRAVTLTGRNSDLSELDRELKTAVVAGAVAVATDNDDLWGDACAFGVPVAGLDRYGDFIKWHGLEASHTVEEFIADWVELLKKGW